DLIEAALQLFALFINIWIDADPIRHRDSIGSLKPMQESSRGADHGSDLRLHVSLYAGNYSEHVYTLLIGYRSGGTPGFPQNLRARDGFAGRRRGSSACQRPSNLPALRVARRCSPVGFDRQHSATTRLEWDGLGVIIRSFWF